MTWKHTEPPDGPVNGKDSSLRRTPDGSTWSRLKPPLSFAMWFCVAYSVLLALAMTEARPLATFMFRTVGKVGARALPQGIVMILDLDDSGTNKAFDIKLGFTTRAEAARCGFTRHGGKVDKIDMIILSNLNFFWTTPIVMASMVLATPVSMRRKAARLAIGLALAYVFLLARFIVTSHFLLVQSDWLLARHEPTRLYTLAVNAAYGLFNKTQWSSSVAGALIWLGVTLRDLLPPTAAPTPLPPGQAARSPGHWGRRNPPFPNPRR